MQRVPYLWRFFSRLFAEVRQVTRPEMIVTVLLFVAAYLYQYTIGGGLSLRDAKTSLIPALWVAALLLAYYAVLTAYRLYQSEMADWQAHKPLIIGDQRKPKKPSLMPGIVTAGGIIAISIVAIGLTIWPDSPVMSADISANQSLPQAVAVFMQCDLTGLPITIPGFGRISVIPLNRQRMKKETWGFWEVGNDTSTPKQWPDKNTMRQSAKLGLKSLPFAYRCQVSNEGSVNLIYVEIPIDLWFEPDGKTATRYSPIISGLDAGESFRFYIVNDCPMLVSGAWQDTAKVQVLGESTFATVPLRRRYRDPAEQIMIFMANGQPWARQLPCED